jgi:NADH:ubiquinone oxidoreductase subunit K
MMFLFTSNGSLLAATHELHFIASAIFMTGLIAFLESREFLSILIGAEIMMLGANFHLLTSATL